MVLISKRPVCNESELSSCITCLISLVTSDYLFDGLDHEPHNLLVPF